MLSYYLLPTTRRLPITQSIIRMSSSFPENPIMGITKSSPTTTQFNTTTFPLIFRWISQLLHLISGAWTRTQLGFAGNLRFISLRTTTTTSDGNTISAAGSRDSMVIGVAVQHDDSKPTSDLPVYGTESSADQLLSDSLIIPRTKATATYICYRPHDHIRSQKLLMSYRRRRISSKLTNRPRSSSGPSESELLKPHVDTSTALLTTCSPLDSADTAEMAQLAPSPSDDDRVSSPASTTATLVESMEPPKMPKEVFPSDEALRSPILLSAQPQVTVPSEEPVIAISMPAPISSTVNDADVIPRPSSQSPPPLPLINTGIFTPKGSFRVRITDKSYCKWHKMVFQHRTHPDEKMASYFKHLHESEEELLEIQRIASLGPVPKQWTPKYQQIWFDWIAKQQFRTWSMTHYSEDRPGI
ncbi:hypothetical protein BJ165DRAFT_1492621 [Panaeolus papilionaceus]|nr:hypothetical protein BJ165DRAFT_1492621 [Panaeolus papilionaceus]